MVKAPMTLGNGDAVGAQEGELVALPFSSPFLSPLSPARKDRSYPEKSLPRCSPRQVDPRVSRPCSAAEPLLSAHARWETGHPGRPPTAGVPAAGGGAACGLHLAPSSGLSLREKPREWGALCFGMGAAGVGGSRLGPFPSVTGVQSGAGP